MKRLGTLMTTALLCLVSPNGSQAADQSAKDRFVGTWLLVSITYVHVDGTKVEPFGTNARGMLVFDGTRFCTQIMSAERPKFASHNRMIGTPEEFKAASQGVVAYFGTYTVDEQSRIVTLHIERSSFPNWDATDQRRAFSFSGDELRYSAASSTANPAESALLIWKRAR